MYAKIYGEASGLKFHSIGDSDATKFNTKKSVCSSKERVDFLKRESAFSFALTPIVSVTILIAVILLLLIIGIIIITINVNNNDNKDKNTASSGEIINNKNESKEITTKIKETTTEYVSSNPNYWKRDIVKFVYNPDGTGNVRDTIIGMNYTRDELLNFISTFKIIQDDLVKYGAWGISCGAIRKYIDDFNSMHFDIRDYYFGVIDENWNDFTCYYYDENFNLLPYNNLNLIYGVVIFYYMSSTIIT